MEPIEWLALGTYALFGLIIGGTALAVGEGAKAAGQGVQQTASGVTQTAIVVSALYLGFLALKAK